MEEILEELETEEKTTDTIELVKASYEEKIALIEAEYQKKLDEKDSVIVQLVKGTTADIQKSQEELLLDRLNKLKRR